MTKDKIIKILFFGDIVGKSGRFAVKAFLENLKQKNELADFVIANVENASHGFGLSERNYNELSECGINCFTSGNHIWDRKDIFNYIEKAEKLIRPLNYPVGTQGEGVRIFEVKEKKIAVLNLLGRVFMQPMASPWEIIQTQVEGLRKITPNVIIDFHAEATAEKICFSKFCAELGVSAVLGTHTHVQTADEKIIDEKMAYITDVGFCGAEDSVIGMEYQTSLKRMVTSLPERYEVADSSFVQINAVEIELNIEKGIATGIKRINSLLEYKKNEEANFESSKT